MARTPNPIKSGKHYTAVDFGAPAQWMEHVLVRPGRGEMAGKIFIKENLGLTGMELSLNAAKPGQDVPFLHDHKQNEELYLFLDGRGEMQVDGEKIPVGPGSAVRIAPGGLRCWRNNGKEELRFIVIQAKAGSLEQSTGGDGIIPEQKPVW